MSKNSTLTQINLYVSRNDYESNEVHKSRNTKLPIQVRVLTVINQSKTRQLFRGDKVGQYTTTEFTIKELT